VVPKLVMELTIVAIVVAQPVTVLHLTVLQFVGIPVLQHVVVVKAVLMVAVQILVTVVAQCVKLVKHVLVVVANV
jgi:hypothetical protein